MEVSRNWVGTTHGFDLHLTYRQIYAKTRVLPFFPNIFKCNMKTEAQGRTKHTQCKCVPSGRFVSMPAISMIQKCTVRETTLTSPTLPGLDRIHMRVLLHEVRCRYDQDRAQSWSTSRFLAYTPRCNLYLRIQGPSETMTTGSDASNQDYSIVAV